MTAGTAMTETELARAEEVAMWVRQGHVEDCDIQEEYDLNDAQMRYVEANC